MRVKLTAASLAAGFVLLAGVGIGSVLIPPSEILHIIGSRLLGRELSGAIDPSFAPILWNLRLPRALLAFIAGAALSVSGAVMQSVLRNPLASSYTIGVSSGASLGAAIIIFFGAGLPLAGLARNFALPLVGFAFGMGTIVLVLAFARRVDSAMQTGTLILTGMVFSLFVSALTTLLSALAREQIQRLVLWQMGSFAMRDWQPVLILAPVALAGIIFALCRSRELDIMTFGEEPARAMGVNLSQVKWSMLIMAAALTGSVVAFVGVIGFVDLVAPHIVRKLFGASHRYVIPMSAVVGGGFMVVCDLVARTIISPGELPVGAVTAIIGGPFFAYIYFSKRGGTRV
ncbi:MAG: iron ABC transporter permease [Oscillospiraceae bacterium]|nr:iron ABC transporter permease [Oscillospiraceae bacterium]